MFITTSLEQVVKKEQIRTLLSSLVPESILQQLEKYPAKISLPVLRMTRVGWSVSVKVFIERLSEKCKNQNYKTKILELSNHVNDEEFEVEEEKPLTEPDIIN